jgi:hypothetical protein
VSLSFFAMMGLTPWRDSSDIERDVKCETRSDKKGKHSWSQPYCNEKPPDHPAGYPKIQWLFNDWSQFYDVIWQHGVRYADVNLWFPLCRIRSRASTSERYI